MKIARLVVLLLLMVSAAAASEKGILVFAEGHDNTRPAAVTLERQADYASMTVTIMSEQKEPAEQFRELSLATQALIQEAKKNPRILAHIGPAALSPEAKTSLMKSSSYSSSSVATVHLLYSLTDNKSDIFKAAQELAGIAKNFKETGKPSYRFSPIRLVVDNPEQYRHKLLQMIFDDLKQTRLLAKKSGKVELTGLNNPVMVRQLDDVRVELFINYSVSMELPAE